MEEKLTTLRKTLSNKEKLIRKKLHIVTTLTMEGLASHEIKVHLELAESAFTTYANAHDELSLLVEDSEVELMIDALEEVSRTFIKIKGILQSTLDLRQTTHEPQNENALSEQGQQSIRLPPMNLPTFTGKLEDWYAFHDQFSSVIHVNKYIDNTRKMHYLKSCLSGEAANVIASLSSTGNNYLEAWSLLTNRYDNERLVLQVHLQHLFNQPHIQSEAVSSLKALVDTTNKHLRALKVLKQPTESWDTIIIYLISSRLPSELRKAWEIESSAYESPSWLQMCTFMEKRIHVLDLLQLQSSSTPRSKLTNKCNSRATTHAVTAAQGNKQPCNICSQHHIIYQCNLFMKSTASERHALAKKAKLCINCLRASHSSSQCSSDKTCKECGGKHHTLLHFGDSKGENNTSEVPTLTLKTQPSTSSGIDTVAVNHGALREKSTVILSTAVVRVYGPSGRSELCRALIDTASESHFITKALASRLGLKTLHQPMIIDGVSNASTTTSQVSTFNISPRTNGKQMTLTALVSPKITVDLPTAAVDVSQWTHLEQVELADPTFHVPNKIDLLISAEYSLDIMLDGKIQGPKGTPSLHNSIFGWIVCGKLSKPHNELSMFKSVTCCTTTVESLVNRFWELEEVPRLTCMSKEDQQCEKHFVETFTRDSSGRYTVRLPFVKEPPLVNNSYQLAVQRLKKVERSLQTKPALHQLYKDFMSDYVTAHHMTLVESTSPSPIIFIPHHQVLNPSSTTTKLRVVFDGSCTMDTGNSLNELLHKGQKLQKEVIDILIRFRLPRYVITADIRQMFRQILVHPDDRVYQGIVWRPNESSPIRSYTLNTVTYGLITSPYHALRVLKQLAYDEQGTHPEAAAVLQRDFYVDEVMTGRDDITATIKLHQELLHLLARGGFELRKWATNCEAVLTHIPTALRATQLTLIDHMDPSIKILGISWNAQRDTFSFHVESSKVGETCTKRSLLSEIARIFDPCGWLSPLVIVAKIIMQHLWKNKLDWDDPLPDTLIKWWSDHRSSYGALRFFELPRHCNDEHTQVTTYSLHGYSDSSEQAYAAALYLVSVFPDGKSSSHLVLSKTRVAPLKTQSIPRLELCGATLLASLTKHLLEALSTINIESVNLWTDSTITLQWIQSDPHRWTTFVSNRVSQIQTWCPSAVWRHVPSQDNPADLASRGLSGDQLITNALWWHGPQWLLPPNPWPQSTFECEDPNQTLQEERKPQVTTHVTTEADAFNSNLLAKYSDLSKLLHVTCYILRFYHNCQKPVALRLTGLPTVCEWRSANLKWIRLVQQECFPLDLHQLRLGLPVKSSSTLVSLNPFLDIAGVLRVGGRLTQSSLPYDMRHPVLLPKAHLYTTMVVRSIHLLHQHAGLNVTMSLVRQKYWVVHGRSIIRKVLHDCVKCYRFRQVKTHQLMADLPAFRVNYAPVFSHCGVDFAGPFSTKPSVGRSRIVYKTYLALFICLTTKAVHLEISTFLSQHPPIDSPGGIESRNCSSPSGNNGRKIIWLHYSNGINGPLGPNLQVHDLVLLKKENMAPTQWPLARILEVHPNPADHFVRVVTLKTKDSVLKRPINKLIRLPIEH
ncbi:unnamed protein product [Macrosiphum euphorbiae]|uniref:DUF5641 domain-containing protein n=1 Tax=Macrosiphum euphorbiae TaxID=13131 RepID=A0AAV0Y601_9HEMI|nr:unnamed protein product [Macrosiphum euphorbiae]